MDEMNNISNTGTVTSRIQLGTELRRVVVEHVEAHPDARAEVASSLGVPADSVDKLLKKPNWDVDLGLRLVDRFNIAFHVVRN